MRSWAVRPLQICAFALVMAVFPDHVRCETKSLDDLLAEIRSGRTEESARTAEFKVPKRNSDCVRADDPPPDPTVSRVRLSPEQEKDLWAEFFGSGVRRSECVSRHLREYRGAFYRYCEAMCRGGAVGCFHLAGYAVHGGVLMQALSQCAE